MTTDDDELIEVLTEAIPKLPPKCQWALIRTKEGASFEDIAAELKVDAPTATRLFLRAMEYLVLKTRQAKRKQHAKN